MWLPVLLLAVMASSSACPESCQCRTPLLDCQGRFPSTSELEKVSTDYTELWLHHINDEDFFIDFDKTAEFSRPKKFFSQLEAISLTNCSVRFRESPTRRPQPESILRLLLHELEQMPNIVSFNVSYNNFSEGLSMRDLVKNKKKLRIVEIKHNNNLKGFEFPRFNVPQLVHLNVADNCLRHFHPKDLGHLVKLQHLDLSDNSLYSLSKDTFAPVPNLQRLNLAGNRLHDLPAELFQNLSSLIELDISKNRLDFISPDILRPLTNLSILKLSENSLIERDLSLLLDAGRRLETVDASRTGLARVPATLSHSVRTLQLAGNQLTSIDSGDFDSYPLLRLLDLSLNKLIIIEEDALGRLEFLEELLLYRNILPSIPKSLPSNLKKLDLNQNAITSLKANDFQGLGQLLELNLSGNVIETIEGGSFRQLIGLKQLDLSDNPIKRLPADTLSGPTKLVVLRMSGLSYLETEADQNQDTAFPYPTPERLILLDLSRSASLASQLLADNAALSACKNLRELDLSYTNISSIRSDFPYVLPQLQKLILTGNNWNCSLDQFWLCEWMHRHGASIEFSTRCSAPANLEGMLLEEVSSLPNFTTTMKSIQIQTEATTMKITTREPTTITPVITSTAKSEITTESQKPVKTTNEPPTTVDNMASWQRIVTFYRNITKDISVTTAAIHDTINSTTCAKTTEESKGKDTMEENELSTVPIKQESEQLTTVSSIYETSPSPATVKSIEMSTSTSTSTSEIVSDSTPSSTTQMYIVKSSWSDDPIPTTTSIPTRRPRKANKNRSTVSPRSKLSKKAKLRSTTTTTTIEPQDVPIEMIIRNSQHKSQKETIPIPEKKSSDHLFSGFSHSKLLLANEEPVQVSGLAQELNDKATESNGMSSGAHPGMLVLLGAAIGAAAALTVILSRRATARHRELYQRQEDIEVHSLTPTTELW